MTGLSRVDNCANPSCKAKFKRLGEGTMSVFAIDQAELWGLPAETKQKVVWLCNQCSSSLYVRADHHRRIFQLVHKGRRLAAA